MLFRNPLGNGRQNDPDDVLNAKRAFTRLGRYQPLQHGLNGIIDRELDQAIKRFQAEEDDPGSTAGSRLAGRPSAGSRSAWAPAGSRSRALSRTGRAFASICRTGRRG
jgi:hypothetical protein